MQALDRYPGRKFENVPSHPILWYFNIWSENDQGSIVQQAAEKIKFIYSEDDITHKFQNCASVLMEYFNSLHSSQRRNYLGLAKLVQISIMHEMVLLTSNTCLVFLVFTRKDYRAFIIKDWSDSFRKMDGNCNLHFKNADYR